MITMHMEDGLIKYFIVCIITITIPLLDARIRDFGGLVVGSGYMYDIVYLQNCNTAQI